MTSSTNSFGSGQFGGQFSGNTITSAQDLITQLLVAIGVNDDDTQYRERCLTFLNFEYLNTLKGRHWRFTHREYFIDLSSPYESGTVAVTEGSDTIVEDVDTANGAAPIISWNSNFVGQMFCPNQRDQDFYRIQTITDSKTLKLLSHYAGGTQSFSAYKILTDRIKLDNKVQTVKDVIVSGWGKIKPVGTEDFYRRKSFNPCLEGAPECYTVIESDPQSGRMTIELYPAPDKRYSVQVNYVERPVSLADADDCYPLIPPEHMDVLYYKTLAALYVYQENPAMAGEVGKQAANAWRRFASDHEVTDSRAHLMHGRRYFNRGRSRYRGFFGLNWFGRVED